jgi:hypothetical protein
MEFYRSNPIMKRRKNSIMKMKTMKKMTILVMEMITLFSGMKINLGCQEETILLTVFLEPRVRTSHPSPKPPRPTTNPTRERPQ